jgi:acetyl esterase/lipase
MSQSLIYTVEMFFIRRFGHRRVFALSEGSLRAWLEKTAPRRDTSVPAFVRKRHKVTEMSVAGYPCPLIEPCDGYREGAPVVLFLHGGGFVFETLPVHWTAIDRIVRATGARVAVCTYPLLPDATLYEAHDVVVAAFARLCEQCDPASITILGDSAGAILALTLTHAACARGTALPGKLVLVSPGQTYVRDPEVLAAMEVQDETDVIVPLSLLEVMKELMPLRPDTPEYMATPLYGDFTGFPPVTVFSGTAETFFPLMKGFVARLQEAAVPVEFIAGEGMCHVWPYIPAPEGRRALAQVIASLRT